MFPKLRFKEFDGDWSAVSLLEISTLITKGTTPKQFIEGNINFLKIEAINQNGFDLSKCQTISDEINNKELKRSILMEGDILFAIAGATIGKNAIVQKELLPANTNQALAIIRLKENYSKVFISKVLNSPLMEKYIDINISTGAQPNLNLQQIGSFSFALPNLEEQTKIAFFLSTVDEKIRQLKQKHELLSQYKQGMMQKLFSQQIRFKADDGSEFEEWASEKISKVFTNKSKSFNPLLNESLPCIELEHLSPNTGQILGTVNSSDQQSTKNLFEPNSVLYGKLRPYLRKFAKPQFKGVCSSEIWVLTGLKISNDYLFQFVQSEQFTELTNIQSGSKMPRADWNVIADAEIEFPCLEEQTKIANFLSAIDQKINVVSGQIEQAKTWKKGLLQQMFV
ncbi:restriction endonuclease subunit S [Acinetobacter towneri]